MLSVLPLALATIFVELPRYRNESFRVEAHYAFGVSKRALVLRDFGSFAKLDYIDAAVAGTRIVTHDLADCPRVAELLSVTFGPPAFVKHDRLSDGTPVFSPTARAMWPRLRPAMSASSAAHGERAAR